jgi:hypothetical protein
MEAMMIVMIAMMIGQNRTEQQMSKAQQNTDASLKIEAGVDEITGQVSQHSAEITGLTENLTLVTEEMHDLRARMARVEDTGATRAAETNGTCSNSNDKVSDLHELSMQLER